MRPATRRWFRGWCKREDLTNAIALNSAQFNMSRILGPTLGGYAMALLGVAGNFFLNGVSFLAVLWALTRIRYPEAKPTRHQEHVGQPSRRICLRAQRSADAGPGLDDGGREFSGHSVSSLSFPTLRRFSCMPAKAAWAGCWPARERESCSGRRDGCSQGRVAASRRGGHVRRSHLSSWQSSAFAIRRASVLSECLAFCRGVTAGC